MAYGVGFVSWFMEKFKNSDGLCLKYTEQHIRTFWDNFLEFCLFQFFCVLFVAFVEKINENMAVEKMS